MEKINTRKRIEFTVSEKEFGHIERNAAKAKMKVAAYCRVIALHPSIRETQSEDPLDAIGKELGPLVFRIHEIIKKSDDFFFGLSQQDTQCIISDLRQICDLIYKDNGK